MTSTINPLRYTNVEAWLKPLLQDQSEPDPDQRLPLFVRGPMTAANQDAWDRPEPTVVLTLGGGPGLELEGTFDRVMLSVDVAGDQGDPDSSEDLALRLDAAVCGVASPVDIDGVRTLSGQRAGGRPSATGVDDGDRWHFGCSYVLRVRSGY